MIESFHSYWSKLVVEVYVECFEIFQLIKLNQLISAMEPSKYEEVLQKKHVLPVLDTLLIKEQYCENLLMDFEKNLNISSY